MKVDDISPEGAARIASADLSAVTVVVCATCRDASGSDAHPRAGAILARNTETAAAGELRVATVECLGNCKRRLSAALLREGCWSYVFGDLTDPGSRVVARKASSRNYVLLAELGNRPRTSYLARIRNPHPDLAGAG